MLAMLAIDDPLQPVLFLAGALPVLAAGAWLLRRRTLSLPVFAAYLGLAFLVGSLAASVTQGAPDPAIFLSMFVPSIPILGLCLTLAALGRRRRERHETETSEDASHASG